MLLSEAWAQHMVPGQRKIFVNTFREQDTNLPALFNMQSSSKAQEFDVQTDELGDFQIFDGKIPYDSKIEGYRKTYTHSEYALGYQIQRRLVQDDLYGTVNRYPAMLSLSARRRREADGAAIFNNAFTGTSGGDSLSLCHGSHTSKNSASTQSNSGTLALTAPNVETTRRRMIAYRSGSDGIMNVNPDLILAPIELEETAYQIINSKGVVNTANNNVNFHYGKYKLVIWPNYLTDSGNWFFIDSNYMKQFLLWFDREPVQFFKDNDFSTLVASFAGYMRYSNGFSDWRWVYGNQA